MRDQQPPDMPTLRRGLLRLLDRAIEMSDERIARYPTYTALSGVRAQLLEVRADVERGGTPNDALKQQVRFGYFAVRELEDMDPDYAEVLKEAAYQYQQQYGLAVYPGL